MEITSEEKLKHILWEYLEDKGYRVSGEVKLPSGFKIDLVARTEDGRYIGYEVKGSIDKGFEAHREGLPKYRQGLFDELYLVMPKEQVFKPDEGVTYIEVVKEWDPRQQKVGVLSIDREGKVHEEKPSPKLQRKGEIKLKRNEEWLKHHIWSCYEKEGYFVEGEAFVLKDKKSLQKELYGKGAFPENLLSTIDLCVFEKGNDFPVGIEVKWKRIGKRTVKDLFKYAESRCLKQLYLAVPPDRILKATKLEGVGDVYGILTYEPLSNNIEIKVEAPELTPELDGLIYLPRSEKSRYSVYKFGYPAKIPVRKLFDLVKEEPDLHFYIRFKRVLHYEYLRGYKEVEIDGVKIYYTKDIEQPVLQLVNMRP